VAETCVQVTREKICPYASGKEVSWRRGEGTMSPRGTRGRDSARCLRTCEGGELGGCLTDGLLARRAWGSEARCASFGIEWLGHGIMATQ
jgi:hypothetical protein